MAFTRITAATNNISSLPNKPTIPASTLKQKFDQIGEDLKDYVDNTLLPELESTTIGSEGAKNIGTNAVGGAVNVEQALAAIISAGTGTIPPDNTITLAKQNSTVKTGLLADLNTTDKTNLVNAINEVNTKSGNNTTSINTVATDLEIVRIAKTSTGTANALIIDTAGTFDRTKNGNILTVIPNLTNTSTTVTISEDGQTAKNIKKADDTGTFVAVDIGDIKKNSPITLVWSVSNDFFILAPKGGNNIKSIQRGTFVVGNTAASYDITITAINILKSIVIPSFNTDGVAANTSCFNVELINSTTIRFTRNNGAVTNATVSWQVIEFKEVKSKQTGSFNMPNTFVDNNVSITSVNSAKSILIASFLNPATGAINQAWVLNYRLLNSTTIVLNGYNAMVVKWQLLEFN